jgi:hypothetical protein
VVRLSHSWLPIGVRERRCSTMTDLCPQCNENRDCYPSVSLPGSCAVAPSFSDPPPLEPFKETHTAADVRYIILKGIESWLLTGDTNDPDSIETIAQIGWFQVLKGYIPNEWKPTQIRILLSVMGFDRNIILEVVLAWPNLHRRHWPTARHF